jgi:hypothetical protein
MGSPSSVPAGAGLVVNKPDRDGPAQQRLLREGNGLPASALPALADPFVIPSEPTTVSRWRECRFRRPGSQITRWVHALSRDCPNAERTAVAAMR